MEVSRNCSHQQVMSSSPSLISPSPSLMSSSSGTGLQTDHDGRSDRANNLEKNTRTNNWRPWSDLPNELLEFITIRLNIVDFFAIGDVCTRWRSSCAALKQKFLPSQAPLIVTKQSRSDSSCYFFNMFDNSLRKVMLPSFAGRSCVGFSGGYLIMEDRDHNFRLINPFTRHEIKFANKTSHRRNGCAIVAALTPSQIPVILVLDLPLQKLRFCRSTDVKWTTYSLQNKLWKITDLAVFKGKVYVITSWGGLGVLSLSSLKFTVKHIESDLILWYARDIRLVATDDKLLMVIYSPKIPIPVYELNFTELKWSPVEYMQDEALFLMNHVKSSAWMSNPSRWGGRGNRIYQVGYLADRGTSHSLTHELKGRRKKKKLFARYIVRFDGTVLGSMPLLSTDAEGPDIAEKLVPCCWYLPNLFNKFARLSED